MRPSRRHVLGTGLALGLSGCGLARLNEVTTPVELYDLTPKSTYNPDLPKLHVQLVIEEPTAVAAVNTDRIAVRPTPYKVQYFPGVRWVDRAPLLVQTLLLQSFENTDKITSVGRQAIGLTSDYSLITDLREFQAEVKGGKEGPLSVLVHLNLKIVREPEGVIIASKSFEHRQPTTSDKIDVVVAAFDKALGKVMRHAVDWVIRTLAEDSKRKRAF